MPAKQFLEKLQEPIHRVNWPDRGVSRLPDLLGSVAKLVAIKLRLRRDLTPPHHSVEDGVQQFMKLTNVLTGYLCLIAVLFFASPLSDYVTGEVLICGGGLHF